MIFVKLYLELTLLINLFVLLGGNILYYRLKNRVTVFMLKPILLKGTSYENIK